jgi:hypothetical protein
MWWIASPFRRCELYPSRDCHRSRSSIRAMCFARAQPILRTKRRFDLIRCRRAVSRLRGRRAKQPKQDVNPVLAKDSTLPKFGFVVCVAHPGSSLRGDHVVVIFASRACGGRGSVGRESCGQGGLLSVSPKASCGRTALSGSSRQQVSGSVDRAGKTAAKWRAVRTAKPCGPGRRCYGQALAEAAVASTGAIPVNSAGVREARRNSAPGRARHKPSNHCAGKAE